MDTNITKKSTDIDKPEVNIMGRPLEYKPIYRKRALEYLKECNDEWEYLTKSEGSKGTVYEIKNKVRLPTLEGFGEYIGVTKISLLRWAERFKDFSHALNKIRQAQAVRLINSGLGGQYDGKMALGLLSANHGIRPDQPETREQSTNITINFVNFTQQGNAVVKEVEKIREME